MQEFNKLRSAPAVADARAEEGEHFAPRPAAERVQQAHFVGVVERHSPLVAVQENPDPLRGRHQLQPGPRLRPGPVLVPVAQPQGPVAALGAQLDPGVPVHRLRGHAQVPLRAAAHLYLPVVPTRLETLGSQDVDALQEALAVARMGGHDLTLHCYQFVSGDVNARVSCVDIER